MTGTADDSPPAERARLDQLFAEAGLAPLGAEVTRGPRPARIPLTAAQELLWWMHRTAPDTTAYNICWAVRIRGELDGDALGRALDTMSERHEILRTTFPLEGAAPVQVVGPRGFAMGQVDLRRSRSAEAEQSLTALLDAVGARKWDLERERPDATLVRIAADEHVLIIALHHIYSDAWSRGLFFRELSACYSAAVKRCAVDLPALPLQFADYALRQREWERSGEFAGLLGAARRRLRGASERLELPADHPASLADAEQPAGRTVQVYPSPLLSALDAYSRRSGVTLYSVLLAGFDALLYRYTGEADLTVLTPVANRAGPELEALVGFFSTVSAVRTTVDGALTFAQLVERVHRDSFEAAEQAVIPIERLAERDGSGEPPVGVVPQVSFGLMNVPRDRPHLAGLSLEFIERRAATVKFDLMLSCLDQNGALRVAADFNAARFERDTVDRLLGHYGALLAAAVAAPDTTIRDLPMITAAENAALDAWNATDVACPELVGGETLVSLLAAQAVRTPTAVALRDDFGSRLTYAALHERADALAVQLRQRGARPGQRVAVCVERSMDLVVALLGVLKSGAAYVPIDPAYPAARLRFMLDDADAVALVTHARTAPVVEPLLAERSMVVVAVDAIDPATPVDTTAGLEEIGLTADQPAYMIYTSGSTGQPKGALNSHRAVVNRLLWMQAQYGLTWDDVVFQKTPASFDVAVWEFFLPLLNGATLALARPGEHGDPAYLAAAIERLGVTTLHFVPSMLQAFLDAIPQVDCASLVTVRRVFCSGEALPAGLVQRAYARLPATAALHNLYGPTECAIDVTHWTCDRNDLRTFIPIGRPVANTKCWILDPAGRQQPVGVAGELHIGGVQVGIGYHRRPELTSERFVAHPEFGRLYRTGDRVRRLPDGALDFLGRTDFQVKLRGFRIELGEIETALASYPGIGSAVVVARRDGERSGAELSLVAYVVPAAGLPISAIDFADLRTWLRARLPEHMVPTAWVALDALPLAPNGKLDRRALPAPERSSVPDDLFVAPATDAERSVAKIFSDVLREEQVSADADFFDIGGHSLLALRVVGRIETELGVRIPYRAFAEARTVAGVAALIERSGAFAPARQARSIVRRTSGDLAPLSCQQDLLYLLSAAPDAWVAYNMTDVTALTGDLSVPALQRALDGLVVRHESLRTVITLADEGPHQSVRAPAPVTMELVDLSATAAGERRAAADRILADRACRSFAVDRDQMLRATLVRLAPREHLLMLETHHIAADGWSKAILLRDLSTTYNAALAGGDAALTPPALQYADYASWQHGELEAGRLDADLAYWRSELADAPRSLDLPFDRPRAGSHQFTGSRVIAIGPSDIVPRVAAFARSHQATPFMVYLAAFQSLLFRYSRQSDLVVGSPAAGRTHPQFEEMVGYLVNTLPLRAHVDAAASFSELLAQVRATCERAYEHQIVPLERVMQELRQPGAGADGSLFHVVFILQNNAEARVRLNGLDATRVEFARGTVKLDLQLSLTEAGDGLRVVIDYRTDLFDRDTIERFAAGFEQLLDAALIDPGEPVGRLPLLGDADRQALGQWNATSVKFPYRSIVELIEEQARHSPDAIAAEFDSEQLSYSALDQRANQLAAYLRTRGVVAETVVALYLERSLEMLVALVAIHRAGGAYLPLDPAYPHDRLEFMLADSGARLLVTDDALRGRLSAGDIAIVSIDGDRDAIAVTDASNMVHDAPGRDQLAYSIYTSGSTGKPKGVEITHGNLANFLRGFAIEVPLDATSTLVAVTPLSFDIAGLELFLPLISGARAVIASRDTTLDPTRLAALISGSHATHMQATPSTWRLLIDDGWSGRAGMTALCGGEALPPALAAAMLARGLRVWNLYGPTEATIWATMHQVTVSDRADAVIGGAVSIGRPMANVQAYVVDTMGELTPIGVAGELLLGGDGIARGYHDRPELTSDRFVSDGPGGAGSRLYRTGDLVRWRHDGELEFLGRLDHQVKLRGHRIELGEIESVLDEHPAVGTAVVVSRSDVPGRFDEPVLVGYVTRARGTAAPVDTELFADLRARLLERLPEYMVPSLFVAIDVLPLTPNGKIDRKALPAPAQASTPARPPAQGDPPRTALEAAVAQVFGDLLALPVVGRSESFFELGGHSVLAIRAIARLARDLGVRIAVRDFFADPTPAGVGSALAQARSAQPGGASAPSGHETGATIVRRAAGRDAPTSRIQQLLWQLEQLNPGMVAYHLPEVLTLHGRVDVATLERALTDVVARHESLRTVFAERDGGLVAVVRPPAKLTIERIDLRDVAADDRNLAIDEVVRETVRRPFDLRGGPLVRAAMVRVGEREQVFAIVVHHVVTDGWSRRIMLRELTEAYVARSSGRAPAWSPLPIQYGDFAAWQQETLRGERLEQLLNYWRDALHGAPAQLDLPTDRPRPSAPSFDGALEIAMLPAALIDRARQVAQAHDTTLFGVLLATLQTLLHRYTRQDDILVGTPLAGRDLAETEGVVGYFANTVVLRGAFADDPSFAELLARTRENWFAAYEHQELPFEQLVSDLQRDTGATVQVLFAMQNVVEGSLQLPDVQAVPRRAGLDATKMDLQLSATEHAGGVRLAMGYRTDLFDAATITNLLAHFAVLLDRALDDPLAAVSTLPLLTDAERALLDQVNATKTERNADESLVDVLDAQADRTPGAAAVTIGATTLTYRELRARSDALADRLVALGVGPGTRVGVLVDRSLEMMVGILGVLKAGAAYVPLDADYPADRIAYMVEDADLVLVLTLERLRNRVPATSRPVLVLDVDEAAPQHVRPRSPHVRATPDDLAYVIYTSGSTGRPKGVMIPHRAVVNYIRSMQELFPLDESDTVLQKAPISFDASVLELFCPLAAGARLLLAVPGGHQDADYLLGLIESERVTTVQFVPSLLGVLLDRPEFAARSAAVRRFLLGGEALPMQMAERLAQLVPGAAIHNLYGPTETTVYSTTWTWPGTASAEFRASAASAPIGRPIANTQIHLLDANLQLLPVGVAGELYIGGLGVARGYHHRAELTDEKFVGDPIAPGETLYRTGDLAKWGRGGTLYYLGRVDHQVKLRGFRVELGEVEAAMLDAPEVHQAAAIIVGDAASPRLVGYFVPCTGVAVTVEALLTRLRERLPAFMVPAQLVELEVMPISPSGKIDRNALPVPAAAGTERPYTPPQTDRERQVASCWAELLRVARVGRTDDFFSLGGHSLLAMRMLGRLYDETGARITLRELFANPQLDAVAGLVDERAGLAGTTTRISRHSDAGVGPLSALQEFTWLLDRASPGLAAYHIHDAVRLRGQLDLPALERALTALVARHETLRSVFVEEDGKPIQRIMPEAAVALVPLALRAADGIVGDNSMLAIDAVRAFVRAPFDLAHGPVFRAGLVQLDANDAILVLVYHHIAADGWSVGVLRRDLSDFYRAALRGEPCVKPALPIRYVDYAVWQRERFDGARRAELLEYWRAQLAGAPRLSGLPADRPRPALPSFAGAEVSITLATPVVEGLKRLAQAHDATLFMVLLAAWQAVLHRYSGQHDLLVGSPVAGREQPETTGVVGYFANTLVLRGKFDGDPTFVELLTRVREICLGALEHQDMPFEVLSRELDSGAEQSGAPLVQVLFMFQNMEYTSIEFPGIETIPVRAAMGSAKADLMLSMRERPDGMSALLAYRTDLFDHPFVEQLLAHLAVLAEAAVRLPEARVSALPLLRGPERSAILDGWNDTAIPRIANETLVDLLEAQAARTPDAIAVTFEGSDMSYAELHSRADQLARRLAAAGIERGGRVGLLIERSPELMVAILGVLKAGGAYVPLDADYPPERLAYMVEDAGMPIILTLERSRAAVPDSALRGAVRVLALDGDADRWAEIDASAAKLAPALRTAGASDLAYIIYTSGSTGRPKGVMIPHRAVVNYVRAMQERFPLLSDDAMIQKAPISFDASVLELFFPIAVGARLVLARPGGHQDPAYLLDLVARERVTTLQFVPSLLGVLLELRDFAARCGTVRRFFIGGEALPCELAGRLARLAPRASIHNLYGPTETTVYSSSWTWPSNAPAALSASGAAAPIGRPLANTRIYVLDAVGGPVPVGVVGEIHISGAGVARGYHNRDDLSGERFIPDPFHTGDVMYRTGDLGRWGTDGTLYYAGRADQQVKLRGFRVELGELESVMLQLPDVQQAAATVTSDASPRLLGYYVARPGAVVSPDDLLARIRQQLPPFMVPSQLVQLERMPLSPSGKVDRRALPVPAETGRTHSHRVPETPTQRDIASLWVDVLGVARIGLDDDFLSLGGNSLLAIRMVSRLRDSHGISMTMRDVFEAPSLQGFAARVSAALLATADADDLAAMLAEISGLSDDDASRLSADGERA